MKRLFMAAALAAGLLLPSLATAQKVGLAARGGTFGVGGEVSVDVSRFLGVRGGLGFIPITPEGDVEDVTYKVNPPKLANVGFDVYPTGGHFRLSTGLLFKHDVGMDAKANQNFEFDGKTYTPAQAGTVHADVTWNATSPYGSFGFAARGKGFGLSFDLGAVFMGEPNITFTSSGGTLSNDASFKQSLFNEQAKAQHDAGKYLKVLPIVSLALRVGV